MYKYIEKEKLYKAQEIADELRLNVMTVYRYIKNGSLGAYKTGKEYRISGAHFQEFLDERKKN